MRTNLLCFCPKEAPWFLPRLAKFTFGCNVSTLFSLMMWNHFWVLSHAWSHTNSLKLKHIKGSTSSPSLPQGLPITSKSGKKKTRKATKKQGELFRECLLNIYSSKINFWKFGSIYFVEKDLIQISLWQVGMGKIICIKCKLVAQQHAWRKECDKNPKHRAQLSNVEKMLRN